MIDEERINRIIQETQQYSVFISDESISSSGSGLLFYPGGEIAYVITARHVIEDISSEKICLQILIPKNPDEDDYSKCKIVVPKTQVAFPNSDSENYDFCVVPAKIDNNVAVQIPVSSYYVKEAAKNIRVFIHGFPGGWEEEEDLLEALDYARGAVIRNISNNHRFTLRGLDQYADQGDRCHELLGFSGSPVWSAEDETVSVTGIVTSGARSDTYRSRIYAEKMEYIRSFMKNRFGLYMQTKIEGIPETDVAGTPYDMVEYDGTITAEQKTSDIDKWIKEKSEAVRGYIDDLKYQKAIDTAKSAISNIQFDNGSKESQRDLMQHLLYCYEIVAMDDEFWKLDAELVRRDLLVGHDYLRCITSTFSKKQYKKTIQYAQEWQEIDDKKSTKNAIIRVFTLLSRVYLENLTYEESVGGLLDSNDRLILDFADAHCEALLYQTIGYVLAEHFHRYTQAIRCLNKSYRVGFDKMVLETLAGAYYFYSIADATDENDRVKASKIDRTSLNKARECFIMIMDKADELFWKSEIKRLGIVIYNTFVFSQDNYRIIRVYPDVRKYLTDLPDRELHDIEMKYARLDCLKGYIDEKQYQTLDEQDITLFSVLANLHAASNFIEDQPVQAIKQREVEAIIKTTIQNSEAAIGSIREEERLPVLVSLINLYGRGIFIYNWNVIDKIKELNSEIGKYDEPALTGAMDDFVFECEHSFDEVVPVFRKRFEQEGTIESWGELLNLYIRHYKFEEADELYKELFSEHRNLIQSEPEFAYRAYIDYVTHYKRDITDALKCFLNEREYLRDPDIADYWELELMMYTNTFNEPERFETDRVSFLENGLITEEAYHKEAFIAYMLNLNLEKAKQHNYYLPNALRFQFLNLGNTPREEIHFLAWQGMIKPILVNPHNKFMLPMNQGWVIDTYKREAWHVKIENAVSDYETEINRSIAIDGWSLCLLAFNNKLDLLNSFDSVFVSHLTVMRLLEEASKTALYDVHQVLECIEKKDNIIIRSADFQHQIDIREKVKYGEPESAIAIAIEKNCPAVIGEPELSEVTIDNYKNAIVRGNEIEQLVDRMMV